MYDGSLRNIEDIEVGDLILSAVLEGMAPQVHGKDFTYMNWRSISLSSIKICSGRVKQVFRGSEPRYFVINGTKVTEEHPYVSKRGDEDWKFVKSSDLKIGDLIVDASLNETEVSNAYEVKEHLETANLDVDETDVFFADNALVHNAGTQKSSGGSISIILPSGGADSLPASI